MGPATQLPYCHTSFDTCKIKCPEYTETQNELTRADMIQSVPISVTLEQNCRDACSLVYIQCINDFPSSFSNECGKNCAVTFHYNMNLQPFKKEQWIKDFTECKGDCGPSLTTVAKEFSMANCYNSINQYRWCQENQQGLWSDCQDNYSSCMAQCSSRAYN
ncbi:hypothetical protein FGO68_gene7361 [Halteria grandinella]|uniref:Uncharacterized protein n=1 Tax=Halteria grandinella TaxID=5974 RepID=A0A8J8NJA9_HALGN|nr:hypothetical protein FGO68_gene7361 [Halteria grandinella]